MCGDTEGVVGVLYRRLCNNVSQTVDHPTTQIAAKSQCRDYSKNKMQKIPNVNEHKCSLFGIMWNPNLIFFNFCDVKKNLYFDKISPLSKKNYKKCF